METEKNLTDYPFFIIINSELLYTVYVCSCVMEINNKNSLFGIETIAGS